MSLTREKPQELPHTVIPFPEGGMYMHFWESVDFLRELDGGSVVELILSAYYNNDLHPAYERQIVNMPSGVDLYAFGEAVEEIDRVMLIHWHDGARDADMFEFCRPSDLVAWVTQQWAQSIRS